MKRHVMVDIEALDTNPGGVILSIGACSFDGVGDLAMFYRRIDLASSVLAGFTINTNTVAWWQEQSVEAKHKAFFCRGALSVEAALSDFARFVDRDTLVWAKGPDFDCVMLRAAYDKLGMKLPFSFRNTRDVRTILALSGVEQTKNPNAHDALADALVQAAAVVRAHVALGRELE